MRIDANQNKVEDETLLNNINSSRVFFAAALCAILLSNGAAYGDVKNRKPSAPANPAREFCEMLAKDETSTVEVNCENKGGRIVCNAKQKLTYTYNQILAIATCGHAVHLPIEPTKEEATIKHDIIERFMKGNRDLMMLAIITYAPAINGNYTTTFYDKCTEKDGKCLMVFEKDGGPDGAVDSVSLYGGEPTNTFTRKRSEMPREEFKDVNRIFRRALEEGKKELLKKKRHLKPERDKLIKPKMKI